MESNASALGFLESNASALEMESNALALEMESNALALEMESNALALGFLESNASALGVLQLFFNKKKVGKYARESHFMC
ncbi:hypothetical protein QUF54_01070 [Candidatus Marithioploca araucensis]|uniref:Uncharacterized protein n=1 Tax=Candidatus Marithioploca araucensis TaxID=70273 RepID=A0ABT7VQK8_9GAMM|nr:hypothetical protein [Candidatus Marithioploca araucensis]